MAQAVYDGSCSVGLGIVKSAKGFEVRTFVKYGPAELSKQIQVGDILLNINERSTTTMPLESLEAVRCCSTPHNAASPACSRSLWALPIPQSG
jgi:C-terminal processing protease CtpA/Prc